MTLSEGPMSKLVWLFEEHRQVVAALQQAEKDAAILTDRYLRLEEDNKKLSDTILKMQEYVTQVQSSSPIDMFERYQKQILQDEPYDDGKIPDSAWLTPGDTAPERNDG